MISVHFRVVTMLHDLTGVSCVRHRVLQLHANMTCKSAKCNSKLQAESGTLHSLNVFALLRENFVAHDARALTGDLETRESVHTSYVCCIVRLHSSNANCKSLPVMSIFCLMNHDVDEFAPIGFVRYLYICRMQNCRAGCERFENQHIATSFARCASTSRVQVLFYEMFDEIRAGQRYNGL